MAIIICNATTSMVTTLASGARDQARDPGKQSQNGLGGIEGGRQHVTVSFCVGIFAAVQQQKIMMTT